MQSSIESRASKILGLMGVTIAVVVSGCAIPRPGAARDVSVAFPPVAMRPGEYIQAFKLRIQCGSVSAIQQIPADWDLTVQRENGSDVVVCGQAGHFSAGLSSFDQLNGAILVRSNPDTRVQAVVTTDCSDPPGGCGRKLPFRNLATDGKLPARGESAPPRAPAFQVVGTVTDGQNGKPIAAFSVTPRYAFVSQGSVLTGPRDEYEGEWFERGKFNLTYSRPLIVGSTQRPGWQFLIEADGYEPFVTRVVDDAEPSPSLVCHLNPEPRHGSVAIGASLQPQ